MSGGTEYDLKMSWWRIVPLVPGVIIGAWGSPTLFVFGPLVLWCVWLARTRWTGLVVGLILLALLVWFVVPVRLSWPGPWVPAPLELFWLYSVLAAVVCGVGVLVERRWPPGVWVLLVIVAFGFVGALVLWFDRLESKPKDEGVLPAPSGVKVVEGGGWCGSGNCARELEVTGDRATEVMRAHLMSRGFSAASSLDGDERMCRTTGLVMTHKVCAELERPTGNSVRVAWYVNR
jgi:hypothetical protein